MARPISKRRILSGLGERVFKPLGEPFSQLDVVEIPLDGLEAIRLADGEGLYQEEAAARMGVSRATFARVLTAARGAVAEALVQGKALRITGGTVSEHIDQPWPCPVHGSGRRRGRGCRCGRRGGRRSKT
jgi:predicted DNA-binding protein (UPF0251 family)